MAAGAAQAHWRRAVRGPLHASTVPRGRCCPAPAPQCCSPSPSPQSPCGLRRWALPPPCGWLPPSVSGAAMGKRVAVVLAGCGVFDGSEIHEASAVLVHLSRGGAEVKIFAPNIEQRDVVNHLKGSPADEKRNVLVESARLARGNIQDLADLKVGEFDAVIFPGGFGVAKNLCSWAVDGKNCTINEHVNFTLQAFHTAKKPIGLCCISPVLAAKVFPGCEVTVGQDKNIDGRFPDAETASAIAELGCKHICKDVSESHVDKANKIVTTCAFMCKAPLHEIFDGIGTMVEEVLKLA